MTIYSKIKIWREKGGVRLWLYLPLAFFSYLLLDFSLRFTYRGLGLTHFLDLVPTIGTLGWCLLLTGISTFIPGRWKRAYLGTSFLLFGVLTVAHSVLQNLFRRFFMFSTLAFAGDGLAFADSQYIKAEWPIVLGITLAALCMAAALLLSPSRGQILFRKPAMAGLLLLGVGVSAVFTVHSRYLSSGNELIWDNFANPSAVYESFTDSTTCLLLGGLYDYTFRDLSLSLGGGGSISDQDKADVDNFLAARREAITPNDHTGIFQGKNVIMVQLEAIDTWMLSKDYMPNLWNLKQQSMTFQNHYSPAYITAGTLNTEFIVNTGLIPATGQVSTSVYQRNAYPFSLASLLQKAGYSTQSFHGSEGNIYNRGTFHPAIGYQTYNSGSDMGMEDYTMDRYLMDGYENIVRENPFMSFIITYSGHGPYHMENGSYIANGERAHELVPEYEGKYIYAVAGAMETDQFIGDLVTQLEADGVLDNTILVFYADHYNYYMMDDAQNMALKGVDTMNLLQHTDFFIYSKDREPEQVEKITSSLDVLPTLENLLGLPSTEGSCLGSDAFSDRGGYVFFADGSWVDKDEYWSRRDPVTEKAVLRNQEIEEMFRISNLMLQGNYFAS